MKFSASTTNLLLAAFLAVGRGEVLEQADNVRSQLDLALESRQVGGGLRNRRLGLHMDFSMFEGKWYDCMHTKLMTFNGRPAEKHVVDQVGCDFGEFGEVSKVGNATQTLQFDIYLLNHCWFHDLGGPGQKECPNDELPDDTREGGNVMVKYSFKGIGSFAHADKIEFFSDHTYIRENPKNKKSDWVPEHNRAKLENVDTLVCEKVMEGIVCDWKINEYRSSSKKTVAGCQTTKKGKTKCNDKYDEKQCAKKGGVWTEECAMNVVIPNGFVYDSFGSYYLVDDVDKCPADYCEDDATDSPVTGRPTTSDKQIYGCYRGGVCRNKHGCCDCDLTEETCVKIAPEDFDPIWSSGCVNICA